MEVKAIKRLQSDPFSVLEPRNCYGAFHLSELAGQTISVGMRNSLIITFQSGICQILNGMHEGEGVSTKCFERAFFIVKMTCSAMVRPASFDLWKAPLDSTMFIYL